MTLSIRISKAAQIVPLVDELLRFSREQLAKAALPPAIAVRETLFAEARPAMAAELERYLVGIPDRAGFGANMAKDAAFPIGPDDVDWVGEALLLTIILENWYVSIGTAAYEAISDQLGLQLSFDLEAASTKAIRDRIAANVTSITDTLREILRNRVEDAIARGLSVEELVRGTAQVQGLRDQFGSRAQMIALTETATAYNLAAVVGYRDSGLIDAVEIFDGDGCGWEFHEDPDLADGSIRTLDEFEATPLSHPNCQRAAGPVVTP